MALPVDEQETQIVAANDMEAAASACKQATRVETEMKKEEVKKMKKRRLKKKS